MDIATLEKLYAKFITSNEGDYLTTGKLEDLGLPEINDSLLDTRVAQLARPILSLEKLDGLHLNNHIFNVFMFMDKVITYFSGLFEFDDYSEEGTKNPPQPEQEGFVQPKAPPKPCKQFNRIKRIFIKNWLMGNLYIAYGQGYLREELRALRIAKKKKITTIEIPDIYPNCKWRLYTLKRDDSGEVTFTSLISGVEGHKFNPDKMVKCSFGAMALFLDWFDLSKEWVAMNMMFVQLAKLSTTRVKAEVSKPETWEYERNQILQWSYYYVQKDDAEMNEILPEVFITPEELKEYMHACMLYISQRMNTLGMVINPTNKAERMTTGEHYKDLKFSSCTESEMLSNLAGICEDCNKNFNTQISVYLTSSLQANGAPKTTQDPFQQFQNNSAGGFDGSFGNVSNQFSSD